MLKVDFDIKDRIKIYLYPTLATIFTISFCYMAIPIAKTYKHKNNCIYYASKQLIQTLPDEYVKDSDLNRTSLSKMYAYQLCTSGNTN